ncbi:neutral/alkaline non-lysosomal ceramidase N-terminal domain-containing protein [Isosphaeraceae bacterium EP7]
MRRMKLGLMVFAVALAGVDGSASGEAWKAGVARASITPTKSTWMAGYGSRTKPSEGAIHDLWAKALAMQAPDGSKALLISLDLCGIGRDLSVPIAEAIGSKHGMARDRIVLACSHTHSGPVVGTNLISMYKLDADQAARVAEYAVELAATIRRIADEAFEHLAPADLGWQTGTADFGVNRRENTEANVPALRQALALKGPVDHDVPVLRVKAGGKVLAVVCGYACHCTVLSGQQFCGDYAGFAQVAIERANPGITALFVAGCGADQNPLPRRTVELAESYGAQLAAAVADVMVGPMHPVEGSPTTAYREVPIAFAKLPTREELDRDAKAADFYTASRARLLIGQLVKDGKLAPTYPYPIQSWKLGGLTWIFLGGEVVVDYSNRLKRNLGSSSTWVSAYCNDVMAYIPSARVLKEGGYEGATSMIYYGLPSPWAEPVEDSIIDGIKSILAEGSASKP